jgi:hypothetical protein
LQPIFQSVSGEQRRADQRFNPPLAELYSKAWSAELLRRLLSPQSEIGNRKSEISWLCTEHEVGRAVHSLAETQAVIAEIRARGAIITSW